MRARKIAPIDHLIASIIVRALIVLMIYSMIVFFNNGIKEIVKTHRGYYHEQI